MLDNVDLTDFWQDSEHDSDYTDDPLTPEKVSLVESTLGFKLPVAYVELMKSQNGGFPCASITGAAVGRASRASFT